jgi:hypothetical protein
MSHFDTIAPRLMKRLMKEFSLKDFQAAGIAGNLGHESNGLHALREIRGSGGRGWAQWTGPRRNQFLSWAKSHKLDWQGEDANIGFLIHELKGPYGSSIHAVEKSPTLRSATIAFERNYERAGIIHMESRVAWAKKALAAYRKGK